MNLPTRNDFDQIVIDRTPIIDVRAPIEFEKGSFPGAVNLPIMDDQDRKVIGTCYKQVGREAAIAMGFKLVSGDIKQNRIIAWNEELKNHPDSIVMCFRGGMRSKITQGWIHESGIHKPLRLEGGYKAFRNHLINATLPENIPMKPIVLGGNTGVGKTILLKQLANAIDLEGLANHRGSSFGGFITPQPSQISFENALAYELITQKHLGHKQLILELESRNIGKNMLPAPFLEYMSSANIVSIVLPIETRVEITWQEYVVEALANYTKTFGELGQTNWKSDMRSNLMKIKRKLGGDRLQYVLGLFDHACESTTLDEHKHWIQYLLTTYYDPMYDYQKSKWTRKEIFEGSPEEALQFFNT